MDIILPRGYVLPNSPFSVFRHPKGLYSIAYDVQLHPTEDPLPIGWDAPRARTYRRLIQFLLRRGYERRQYSLYTSFPRLASGEEAWDVMLTMMHLFPYGKMSTTVGGLAMFFAADEGWNVTEAVNLGGPFSTRLYGPVPRSLVPFNPHNHLAIRGINGGQPHMPPRNVLPPTDTRDNPNSCNPANYLM